MSPAKVRFGIVGAGVAADTHARELQNVIGADLVANFARDPHKATAFASAHGITRSYSDFGAFVNDPNIDAVIIATPNGMHLDYGDPAARAGKHVVIEKPLEITEERARLIIEACKAHDVRLFVIYQRRSSKAAQQAMRDIRSGKLGQILLVNIVDNEYRERRYYTENSWRGSRKLEGGGCVITQSTHMIDLAQYLVGPISKVAASVRHAFHDIETEDTAAVLFEFASGALGTLTSSTAAFPGQRHMLTISGTRGSIMINGEHDEVIFRRTQDQTGDVIEIPASFSFIDPSDPRDYPTLGQRIQLQEIVDSILRGPPQPPDDETFLMAVRVIDTIYQSANSERFIEIAHSSGQ